MMSDVGNEGRESRSPDPGVRSKLPIPNPADDWDRYRIKTPGRAPDVRGGRELLGWTAPFPIPPRCLYVRNGTGWISAEWGQFGVRNKKGGHAWDYWYEVSEAEADLWFAHCRRGSPIDEYKPFKYTDDPEMCAELGRGRLRHLDEHGWDDPHRAVIYGADP